MIKRLAFIAACFIFVSACNNNKEEKAGTTNKWIYLRTDTVNIVTGADTMVIGESTCRGCAYEASTEFSVSDSLGLVTLYKVVTTDNNPADVNGGNVSKDILILPVKPGVTWIKVYKFLNTMHTAKDSALVKTYNIEIRN